MKKYLTEFIGTFMLIFCSTGVGVVDQETHGIIGHVGISMTCGLAVMTLIYAFGVISGAHFNPAVSLAFIFAGKFPAREFPPYLASQVMGAFCASLVLRYMFPDNTLLGTTIPMGPESRSFLLEIIMTFFLMLVVLNVAHGSKEQGLFAGLAIGSTILLECMFGGPISGASLNPARSLAPAVVSGHLEHLWIYLTAPFIGTSLAIPVWRVIKTH
jgi:aquaporin Z